MVKRKAKHVIPGMNAASAQGTGAGYNEEMPMNHLLRHKNKTIRNVKRINNYSIDADAFDVIH